MIQVNRVYVDPEGYIEDRDGHRFEDQKQIKNITGLGELLTPCSYHTIEPIQVELLYQWKGCGGNKWLNTNKDYWNSVYHPAEKRIVARIVTEKQASDEKFLSLYNINPIWWQTREGDVFLPDNSDGGFKPSIKEPARKTASEILIDYGIDMNFTDSWFFEQAVKAVEHALKLHQQPTEWIPVTSDIPSSKLFDHKQVDIKLCDGSVIVKTIPQRDGDFWSEVLYAFITLDKVTDWRKSLPEPPKP